ncbi:uncharacterized protein LOC110893539 [Helianthus annuus]|uniref:uncharacterized protein LOC110893539 n=1 Tax=Helianthus annuus TaxID=4232 RepID=UPI000B9069B8|nr:uncharacterized protein LOC110893539 [Helianthus annuus]
MPKEWDKLMEAAKIVAQTEESLAGNKNSYTEDRYSKGSSRDNNKRNKNKSQDGKSGKARGYDDRPRYREDARETIDRIGYRKAVRDDNREKHWTPLIKTPKEVLMTENHDFKAPRPMTNKKGQDPNLYCDFHKDSGHLIDDCISLRQEIEKALKSAKLGHLVKNVREETRQIQRHDDRNHKKVRRLETHMVNGPRYSTREKGKRLYEPSWQEQRVIFPVVRGGPHATRPVVITGIVGHYETEYIFIDPGSTADIIYEQCFNQFDDEDKTRLEPVDYPLSGFCNEMVFPLGQISFPVTFSDGKHSRTTNVNFMVMPVKSRHDVLIGRETQGELNMVTSTPHSAIGFLTETGVAIIYAKKEVMSAEEMRPTKAVKVSTTKPEKWVLNRKDPEQTVTIGHAISPNIRTHLKQLMFRNMDIFAWTPTDMTGVPCDVTEHCLNTYPSVEPKVQRRRSLGANKTNAMNEQVCELLKAGILREVRYQSWVANPVMVEKSNGGWRMGVDYTDLNKVQMKLEEEDKTAFRTDLGIFCYTKMLFGLKNAGAAYQRLMDTIFAEDIGRHIEVYIDDLVIKSTEEDQMLKDIEKTFNSLRSVNMKLNPTKCSFGMEEGKFLGFIVTNGGFKVNPEKVQAIERMLSPRTIREMQRLVGRLAALNRFLSNHAAKSYHFISTLRNCVKKQEFKWTPKAETAFQQMKECLIKLPTLTAPFEKEPLILYLSSSDKAVGSVLLMERNGVQTPIYYVSRVLTDPETRYSTLEKLYSPTFTSGPQTSWGGHNILYRPRPAIKGQVLADFITEVPVEKIKDCEIVETPVKDTSNELWLLYTDGASNEDGAGAGLCLVSPEKHEFTYTVKLDFKNTNNEAEYEAFLAGLRLAIKMGAQNLQAHVDSLLIASQINGIYDAKGEVMALYLDQAKELLQRFKSYKVVHINHSENKPADALSKLASTSFHHLAKDVRIEVLKNPSVLLRQVNMIEIGDSSWMTPIIKYLQEGILPESRAEARKIQNKALHYEMNGNILYRKSFLGPLLRCVDP